jgi:hypothetical protein
MKEVITPNGIILRTAEHVLYSGTFGTLSRDFAKILPYLYKALDFADSLSNNGLTTNKANYLKKIKANKYSLAYVMNNLGEIVALTVYTVDRTDVINEITALVNSRLIYSTESLAAELLPYFLIKVAEAQNADRIYTSTPRKGFDKFAKECECDTTVVYQSIFKLPNNVAETYANIEGKLL